jgi:hypothetical protein
MRKLAILATFVCAMLSMGCSVDELTLSQAEVDDLVENVEGAIQAYSELTDFTLNVALGEEDIEGYDYDVPTAANGWTATLNFTGQALPSGTGTMTLTIQVLADGVPVDPYGDDLDLENLSTLSVTGAVAFNGVSTAGAPIHANGTFTWTGEFDTESSTGAVALTGDFVIGHNDYEADLHPRDFTLLFDLDTSEITEVTGSITGVIDIPNFLFDADVEIVGDGLDLIATVDIVGNTVEIVYPLSEF